MSAALYTLISRIGIGSWRKYLQARRQRCEFWCLILLCRGYKPNTRLDLVHDAHQVRPILLTARKYRRRCGQGGVASLHRAASWIFRWNWAPHVQSFTRVPL